MSNEQQATAAEQLMETARKLAETFVPIALAAETERHCLCGRAHPDSMGVWRGDRPDHRHPQCPVEPAVLSSGPAVTGRARGGGDVSEAALGIMLSFFRVGGFDDEADKPTEPVKVTCSRCGQASPWFTYRDDGGADHTTPLSELVAWAQGHQCLQTVKEA